MPTLVRGRSTTISARSVKIVTEDVLTELPRPMFSRLLSKNLSMVLVIALPMMGMASSLRDQRYYYENKMTRLRTYSAPSAPLSLEKKTKVLSSSP